MSLINVLVPPPTGSVSVTALPLTIAYGVAAPADGLAWFMPGRCCGDSATAQLSRALAVVVFCTIR